MLLHFSIFGEISESTKIVTIILNSALVIASARSIKIAVKEDAGNYSLLMEASRISGNVWITDVLDMITN